MKRVKYFLGFFSILFLTLTSSLVLADEADTTPRYIVAAISDVLVPEGLTSDENAFVVVSGTFPNGCYQWNRAEVRHLSSTIHQVQAKAVVNQGQCIMVLVPFTKQVSLGQLKVGEHLLRFLNGDGTYFERTVMIEP